MQTARLLLSMVCLLSCLSSVQGDKGKAKKSTVSSRSNLKAGKAKADCTSNFTVEDEDYFHESSEAEDDDQAEMRAEQDRIAKQMQQDREHSALLWNALEAHNQSGGTGDDLENDIDQGNSSKKGRKKG